MNFKLDYLVCINKLVAKQFCHEIDSLDCTKFLYWNSKKYYKSSQKTLWLHQGLSNDIFSTDLSKSINPAATVTYAALQVIYYMGFKKVIILGLDHNFQLDKSKIPNTTEKYTHQKDVNHFIDNYFPKGTKWETPDLYSSEFFYKKARKYLKQIGLDYEHGTGHGVGFFLNVHEGPQSISKAFNNIELQEGMIVSNEPGFYKNGEYGIRVENLVLVKKSKNKNFLEFETLTMFPYEKNLIDKEMLNIKQKQWINDYHETIYLNISPHLKNQERAWLREKSFKFNLSR